MDEATFQTKLAELMQEISTLPKAEREKLAAMAEKWPMRAVPLDVSPTDWCAMSV